ncbi:hypothetical protein ABI59_01135 [Acidobacteria bacterium Mor1]|nr:hypothetical protein ABI59_01135 [Acidobacteria bacterium Mor1]
MRVQLSRQGLDKQKADVAVCFAFEGDRAPRGVADAGLRRELSARLKAERFKGQVGDRILWSGGKAAADHVMVLGLGKLNGDGVVNALARGVARAARMAADFSATKLAVQLPEADASALALEVQAATEGALAGGYRFERHLTDPDRRGVQLTGVHLCTTGKPASLRKALDAGTTVGRAVCLARDLVNEAPSRLNPPAFATIARQVAKESGLGIKVLTKPQIEKIGMHALLAVSRGSDIDPRVVHLTHKPKRKAKRRIVLIGKGVTFDSGGLNLKPSPSMRYMKGDMGGAAAVLATMSTLGALGCDVEVHAFLGLVENMTGGNAYKPGDILDTLKGKTVEVGNTDAEGRLVMCDLLCHAERTLKPDAMIDVATLTGAIVVALGPTAVGVFSRHDGLADEVLDAGRVAGEKLWRMPMYDEYLAMLQHGPADLVNVGERWGGAITAALFLGEFVDRGTPWLHLDIAGPAFAESASADGPSGGTGVGVRTLARWLTTGK